MKKFTTSILVTGCLLCALVTASAQTTTSGVNIINSASGNANNGMTVTNGLYPQSIAPTSTLTNLVCLNPGVGYGNTLSLQFTANTMLSTSSNTVAFVISKTAGPITIAGLSTNANANWYTSTTPRSLYQTVTLAFAGTQVTTNIVLGPTTGYCSGCNVYLETINMGTASTGNFLKNYTVSAVSGL